MYERSRKVSRKGSENLDKHLLEALYHRYYKELYIFVYSLCGSETVTDDILQDTFLKALLALKDSHTNMRAWLYMVARNLYYNYYNRQKNLFSIETEEVDRRNSREKIISGEGEAEISYTFMSIFFERRLFLVKEKPLFRMIFWKRYYIKKKKRGCGML